MHRSRIPTRPVLAALLASFLAVVPASAASPAASGTAFTALSPSTAFTAHYDGHYTVVTCISTPTCSIRFSGLGLATLLGQNKETMTIFLTSLTIPCAPITGTATLTSFTSADALTTSLTGTLCLKIPPIKGATLALSYTITGGRGSVRNTAGSGTINTNIVFNRTYSDKWKGTITSSQ